LEVYPYRGKLVRWRTATGVQPQPTEETGATQAAADRFPRFGAGHRLARRARDRPPRRSLGTASLGPSLRPGRERGARGPGSCTCTRCRASSRAAVGRCADRLIGNLDREAARVRTLPLPQRSGSSGVQSPLGCSRRGSARGLGATRQAPASTGRIGGIGPVGTALHGTFCYNDDTTRTRSRRQAQEASPMDSPASCSRSVGHAQGAAASS